MFFFQFFCFYFCHFCFVFLGFFLSGGGDLKKTCNSYFCITVNPQKSSVMNVCLMKLLKNIAVTKKVTVCFNNLIEEKF